MFPYVREHALKAHIYPHVYHFCDVISTQTLWPHLYVSLFGIKSDVVSSICLRLTGKLNVMEQNVCVQQMLSMQSDGIINVEKCQKIICNV